ncbi:MAG: hypothetical protein IKC49_00785 [Clostridia bacterium]|nr:hypothetical protein [Clostridia bacterium]
MNDIENLVYKRFLERLHFSDLEDILKDKDWKDIRDFVLNIKDENIRERLIGEAIDYYASIFACKPEEVLFGNYTEVIVKEPYKIFPYACVIGNISISNECKDLSKLNVVMGDLYSNGVKDFSNLEYVYGIARFVNGGERRINIHIPKLKKCRKLELDNVIVDSLKISDIDFININHSKINELIYHGIIKEARISDSLINYLNIFIIEKLYSKSKEFYEGTKIRYIDPHTNIEEVTAAPTLIHTATDHIKKIKSEIEEAKAREIKRKSNLEI